MGNYFWNLALFLFEQKVVKIKKLYIVFALPFFGAWTRHNTWHNSRIIWSVLQFSNSTSWFPQLTDIISFENIKINIIYFYFRKLLSKQRVTVASELNQCSYFQVDMIWSPMKYSLLFVCTSYLSHLWFSLKKCFFTINQLQSLASVSSKTKLLNSE